jgi:hypothetical protein
MMALIAMFSWFQSGFTMEITTCDCDNPVFIGVIDSDEPDLCREPLEDDYVDVVYEVIEQVEPPLTNIGYLCRQWLRQKKITGYFFGGYDTVFQETPYETTPEECLRMASTKQCAGNSMVTQGRTASFNKPPEGEGVWMDIKVYTLFNCELEVFNVTQECFNCPIESPFGILSGDASSNKTSTRKGHLTYVWEKPMAHPDHCTYDIVRKGFGVLHNLRDSTSRTLKDTNQQLEFIIGDKPETICSYDGCYRSEGLPNTFIRYTVTEKPRTTTTTTTTTPTPVGAPSTVHGLLVFNKHSDKCLGTFKPPGPASIVRAEDCDGARAEYFMYVKKKLISVSKPNLCVALDAENPSSRNVVLRKCVKGPSSIEDWSYNQTSGTLSIDNKCISIFANSVHLNTRPQSRPYAVGTLQCGELSSLVTDQRWELVEQKQGSPINILNDDSLVAEVSHHQYIEGKFIDLANQLNDEIRSVYCEAYRTKQFVALTLSQTSPMTAGMALGLPVCQRVLAKGQAMAIQQCKVVMQHVGVERTKCGYEPKWGEFTVGYDGFTKVKFQPCLWNGFANLNGKAHEYVDGTWTHIPSSVKLATVGLAAHFDETVDNEAQYLKNLETSFRTKEIDQMNMVGELMALMQHEDINSISPIILHAQSVSQFGSFANWILGLKIAAAVAVVLFILFFSVRCCPSCKCKFVGGKETKKEDAEQPLSEMTPSAPPNSPQHAVVRSRTTKKGDHPHVTLRLSSSKGYVWEDGCPLILSQKSLSGPPMTITDLDDVTETEL